MARLVTLLFKNNADAEAFAKQAQDNKGVLFEHGEPDAERPTEIRPAHVSGMYPIPTAFCTCPRDMTDRFFRDGISKMGAKFRWQVHPKCGKPARNSWQGTTHNMLYPGKWDGISISYLTHCPALKEGLDLE
jgi:hypothetical protein